MMTTTTAHGSRHGQRDEAGLPAPLAVDATTAQGHAGPCALCSYAILRGQRFAVLVPENRAAHLVRIARHAETKNHD